MIKFINVSKRVNSDKTLLLNSVNINIEKGDFVYLVGDSGSGKTTLLKMIYREKKPETGKILINGIDIVTLNKSEIPLLRRKIGIIFQELKLLKKRTVYKNIAYALEVIGEEDEEIKIKVDSVLKFIGLYDKKDECIENVSAGEKQRVAIARAIVNRPEIILCDEITGNLDYEMSVNIIRLLKKLNDNGTTVLFATHDEKLIQNHPNKVITVCRGVVKYEA